MCVYYIFERGMDRGADRGGVGEIAREMRVVYKERDEYDVTARDSLECIYARGEWREAPGEYIFLCVVCWYVWV